MFEKRKYRQFSSSEGLFSFVVRNKETDLFITAQKDLSVESRRLVEKLRFDIESYICAHPYFASSLVPVEFDAQAPQIVRQMMKASQKAGVGPMASVAGAIAQYIARSLNRYSKDVLVENGGDTYIYTSKIRILGIWAGKESPFNALGLKIEPVQSPISVCCSSGTVGHSLSFGKADAAIILSSSGALADAVATGIGNRVQTSAGFEAALAYAKGINGVLGALLIKDDQMVAWGCVQLCDLQ